MSKLSKWTFVCLFLFVPAVSGCSAAAAPMAGTTALAAQTPRVKVAIYESPG